MSGEVHQLCSQRHNLGTELINAPQRPILDLLQGAASEPRSHHRSALPLLTLVVVAVDDPFQHRHRRLRKVGRFVINHGGQGGVVIRDGMEDSVFAKLLPDHVTHGRRPVRVASLRLQGLRRGLRLFCWGWGRSLALRRTSPAHDTHQQLPRSMSVAIIRSIVTT